MLRLLLPRGAGAAGARRLPLPGGARGLSGPGWAWYEALSASAPVAWAEAGLAGLQAASGLPWWASVVAAAALLRTGLTLPLGALQGRVLAQLENLQPEVRGLALRLRQEVSASAARRGWSQQAARFHFRKNLSRMVSELYVRDNCHPFKASLLIWIQVPVWVFVSIALRNFSIGGAASEGFPIQEQLSVGGTLWFVDLTAPDHTLILPITLGLLNLLIVEVCTRFLSCKKPDCPGFRSTPLTSFEGFLYLWSLLLQLCHQPWLYTGCPQASWDFRTIFCSALLLSVDFATYL